VPVNPKVMQWARKERGLCFDEAADLTGLPIATIQAFESGATLPTLGELEAISRTYEISFVSLLMPAPLPRDCRPKIADFRFRRGAAAPVWSHALSVTTDVIKEQLDGLAELVDADTSLCRPIRLPHLKLDDNVEVKAKEERARIGLPTGAQNHIDTPREVFKRWRFIIETLGVFVHVAKLGDLRECRGYSVFDNPKLPAIVINSNEGTVGARLFTLIHEYAHLLLRKAGLCDQNGASRTEAFCNAFAAHFLMPRKAFVLAARSAQKTSSHNWTDRELKKLADCFGVSMSAAALQLEQIGIVPIRQRKRKIAERADCRPKLGGQPMGYTERQISRLGMRHLSLVLTALERGYLNQIEAYDLTEVNPKHFDNLRSELNERRTRYGG